MSEDMSMDVDPEFVYSTPMAKMKHAKPVIEKNAHLKGRKRFNADLDDMKEGCIGSIAQNGFKVKSRFKRGRFTRINHKSDIFSIEIRAGDDEGSIEVIICNDRGEHVVTVNLLVSGERCDSPYRLRLNIHFRYF